jgi:molybdopterin/thiamine biosynthesis adenylyltransferase/rhodanese-related sulfurtransferase
MATYRDLVNAARDRITEVGPDDLMKRMTRVRIIDVREPDEYHTGAIPGALLMPRGILERDIATIVTDPDTDLVLYCSGGSRSALAASALQEMGYRVSSLQGGFEAWKRAGHPWGDPGGLTTDQRRRYARHVRLPEVGEAGQVRLLGSRVLIVGAGGLGSPAAIYLAAAGVGTIGVVDDDLVDATNLQRQIVHNLDRVGMAKVESARETLLGLNPDIKVETHRLRLDASNAEAVLSGYDLVIDGGDNFPTRYLVNDVCLRLGIPSIHGSIFRFEGQVSVFVPYEGPCYRCLHPLPPPPELAPSCAEAGVLGVLPGVIGTIQAMEGIKLLLGIGDTLQGRLLVYDALEQAFTDLRIARDPSCPACADPATPPRLVDYDDACRPAS